MELNRDSLVIDLPKHIQHVLAQTGVATRGFRYDWLARITVAEALRQIADDFSDKLKELKKLKKEYDSVMNERNRQYWNFSRQANAKPVNSDVIDRSVDLRNAIRPMFTICGNAKSGEQAAQYYLSTVNISVR